MVASYSAKSKYFPKTWNITVRCLGHSVRKHRIVWLMSFWSWCWLNIEGNLIDHVVQTLLCILKRICNLVFGPTWRSYKLTYVRPFVRLSVTRFSRDWLIRIFWFFAQWCKMVMPKMWRSPIFEKKFFPGENAGNMPEITVFWTFLKILSLVFCNFLLKDAY